MPPSAFPRRSPPPLPDGRCAPPNRCASLLSAPVPPAGRR
ncbi:hypothetical protein 2209_scaffold64_00049 [Bacteriophage sp.]|nr:hypothetical protein 2209_scaffold64_00049 [Bacteriophage sp.]